MLFIVAKSSVPLQPSSIFSIFSIFFHHLTFLLPSYIFTIFYLSPPLSYYFGHVPVHPRVFHPPTLLLYDLPPVHLSTLLPIPTSYLSFSHPTPRHPPTPRQLSPTPEEINHSYEQTTLINYTNNLRHQQTNTQHIAHNYQPHNNQLHNQLSTLLNKPSNNPSDKPQTHKTPIYFTTPLPTSTTHRCYILSAGHASFPRP